MENGAKVGHNTGAETASTASAHIDAVEACEDMTTPTSKRTPAFQFYPNDFLGSSKVQRMSLTERGAYITLLAHCWLDGGLSTDLKTLAAILHVKPLQFERMWSGALHECFAERGGKLQNNRLDAERKKQTDFRKKQKDNADKRWDKSGNATALPPAVARHESGNALQSSSSSASAEKSKSVSIVAKRNLNAAWEGARSLFVLHAQHRKFLGLLNGAVAEPDLFAWYEQVATSWAVGPHKSENTGGDMPKFWDARFAEKWPPSPTEKPKWGGWKPSQAAS